GKQLYARLNCVGCHANGGGGIGPPLMDPAWIYGGFPSAIYESIVEGRPNGMPAFGGRLADSQAWQLVAYVQALSGQLRRDVRPLLVAAFARARRPALETPILVPDMRSETQVTRAIIAGVVLTAVMVVGLVVASTLTARALGTLGSAQSLTVEVTGHQWWWE